MFPNVFFSPVCEFLADFVDSHTSKTDLLWSCLYIPVDPFITIYHIDFCPCLWNYHPENHVLPSMLRHHFRNKWLINFPGNVDPMMCFPNEHVTRSCLRTKIGLATLFLHHERKVFWFCPIILDFVHLENSPLICLHVTMLSEWICTANPSLAVWTIVSSGPKISACLMDDVLLLFILVHSFFCVQQMTSFCSWQTCTSPPLDFLLSTCTHLKLSFSHNETKYFVLFALSSNLPSPHISTIVPSNLHIHLLWFPVIPDFSTIKI